MNQQIEISQAMKDYEVRQYERALQTFTKYAKLKDPIGYYYLGLFKLNGYACKQNDKEAFQYFSKAKEERNIDAAYMLGMMYESGIYVQQSYEEALKYYQAAFHEGHIESGIKIAIYLETGRTTEVNLKKALETYVECAKKDHPFALYKIGMAYLTGSGIKKSIENAHLWLNKALLHGSNDAMNQFRVIGSKSSSDVRTREQILSIGKELWEKSRYDDSLIYLEIAYKEGSIEALYYLIKANEEGLGKAINQHQAFHLLEEGCKLNDAFSYYSLALKYLQGEGCFSSFIKAETLLIKASELGSIEAKHKLKAIRGDIFER